MYDVDHGLFPGADEVCGSCDRNSVRWLMYDIEISPPLLAGS